MTQIYSKVTTLILASINHTKDLIKLVLRNLLFVITRVMFIMISKNLLIKIKIQSVLLLLMCSQAVLTQ